MSVTLPMVASSSDVTAPERQPAAEPAGNEPTLRKFRNRAGRLARRHWALLVLLAAGLGLRVVTQIAYRPALFYIDSYKYLRGSGGSDPVGYNILLKPILWVGNLAMVAGFQHLLGLAMAVTIYTLLTRRGAPRWAATLAAAPILLDAYQLQMEQTIMPDVTFEALILAGLAILLWRPRQGFWRVAAGALVLGLTADVRQIGELLIIPAVVFAVLVARGWRRRLGYLALAVACFAVPVLGYMTVSSVTGNGFALTTSGGNVLYGRAAVAADCATLKLPADERSLCPLTDGRRLGYRPDRQQRGRPPPQLPGDVRENSVPGRQQLQPCRAEAAAARDPAVRAPGRDPAVRADPGRCSGHHADLTVAVPGRLSHISARRQPVVGRERGPALRRRGARSRIRPLATFLRAYQLDGGYTPGPLLAVMTAAGAIGSLSVFAGHRSRRGQPPRPPPGC